MFYMSTTPSPPERPSPEGALQRAVRDLRGEATRRVWATRGTTGGPTFGSLGAMGLAGRQGGAERESDALAGLLAALRDATARYVGALRAEGSRPEQMLVRVKAFVRDAMSAEGWHEPEAVQALTAEVVRCSIDTYYDRDDDRAPGA